MQEFTLFVSWKNQTAQDIVDIDVSENSNGNVYSKVIKKVVAYQHGVY